MKRRSLRGAVVVVAGATRGAGRSTALAFAHQGTRLVLAARGSDGLDELVAECERAGAQAIAVPYDSADAGDAAHLAASAVERYGRIDVWVHLSATLCAGQFGDEPLEEVERLVDVNVLGYVYAAREAMAQFREQGSGTLILVSSLLGIFPNPMVPIYSMTKFAVRGLALNLRQSVMTEPNIDVCVVLPGPIDTTIFEHAGNHTGHQLRAIPPATAPERVAATIVSCARRPRRQATTGIGMHLLLAAHHLVPRLTEFGVAQASARLVLRAAPAADTAGAMFDPAPAAENSGHWRRGNARRAIGDRVGRRLAAVGQS